MPSPQGNPHSNPPLIPYTPTLTPRPLPQSVGRRTLAIRLLEEEPSPTLQVPLLISLAKGQDVSALTAGEE